MRILVGSRVKIQVVIIRIELKIGTYACSEHQYKQNLRSLRQKKLLIDGKAASTGFLPQKFVPIFYSMRINVAIPLFIGLIWPGLDVVL